MGAQACSIPTPVKLTQGTEQNIGLEPATEQTETRSPRTRPQPLTGARGRDVSAPRVSQHRAVAHHAHADLVGASFEPQDCGHGGPDSGSGDGTTVVTGTKTNSPEPSDGTFRRQKLRHEVLKGPITALRNHVRGGATSDHVTTPVSHVGTGRLHSLCCEVLPGFVGRSGNLF